MPTGELLGNETNFRGALKHSKDYYRGHLDLTDPRNLNGRHTLGIQGAETVFEHKTLELRVIATDPESVPRELSLGSAVAL
jgi:hypothetical protein